MKQTILIAMALVATAFGVGVIPASASMIAITTPTTTASTSTGVYVLGFEFSVGSVPLSVTALGVWDAGTNGLAVSHEVGIWTNGGTLLASLTVPSGTSGALVGEYRYVSLGSPLSLTAGTNYRIAALSGTDLCHLSINLPASGGEVAPVFSTPNVNFVTRRGNPGGPFAFPNHASFNLASASAWDFPNFQYEIPEPASLALLALGGVACLPRRKA